MDGKTTLARVRRDEMGTIHVAYPNGARAELAVDDPEYAQLVEVLETIRNRCATSRWFVPLIQH